MSENKEEKKTFLSVLKNNWANLLVLCAAIGTVINFYWKADAYIQEKVNSEIKKQIAVHDEHAKAERDSIITSINTEFFVPMEEEVKLNKFFIDKCTQGLHAEFEPFVYNGIKLYKSDPNLNGYAQHWHIFERNKRWEIYQCTYNPTHDCFEFYDVIKKKRVFIGEDN